jgi:hypothetical protein
MNERNPIDDLFREKLQGYNLDSPMFLFDKIAEERAQRAAVVPPSPKYGAWLLILALLIPVLGSIWIWHEVVDRKPRPNQAFPIPQFEAPVAANTISIPSLTPTEQEKQAGSIANSTVTASIPVNKLTTKNSQSATTQTRKTSEIRVKDIAALTPTQYITITNATEAAGNLPTILDPAKDIATSTISAQPASAESEAPTLLDAVSPIETRLLLLEEAPLPVTFKYIPPRPKGWRMYTELMLGEEFYSRTLKAKDPDFDAYRTARESTEKFRNGQSYTVRFSMVSQDGIAIRSGLNLSQFTESFSMNYSSKQIQSLTPIYGTDGKLIGTDTSFQTLVNKQHTNNRFTAVNIPVLLGYERKFGQFTLSINGGVMLNMVFNQKGSFLSPDRPGATVEFTSNQPNAYPAFRNRLGVGMYASAALSYPISSSLRLVAEPYARWGGGSVTASDYALDQHYWSTGFSIGIRKKINKTLVFAKP